MTDRAPAPPARRRRRHAAILTVVVGLGGAACSSGSTGSSAGTTDTTADVRSQAVRFAECLRTNGVGDFPDPEPDGSFRYGVSVTPEVWLRATEACKELEPPGTFDMDRDEEEQSAALDFADCMRENGVTDFPDPIDGEPLVNTYRIPSSDSEDGMRILNAAMEACRGVAAENAGNEP